MTRRVSHEDLDALLVLYSAPPASKRAHAVYAADLALDLRDARARIVALESELAEARKWKAKWETCEKWRKAYQEAKGELFAMGGEIAEAAIQHMPCNEATVDRWFRAEYVHKTAFDAITAELAEARKDGERLDWLASRTHWVDERMHLGLRGAIDAARGPR